jgi:hypothetical protein
MSEILSPEVNDLGDFSDVLKVWLFVFDEMLSWFVSLTQILEFGLSKRDDKTDLDKVFFVLSGSIVSQLIGIRKLVTHGLDLPAKQILRSVSEHLEVLMLISLQPDISGEFIGNLEIEDGNKFWHKYISKNKSRNVFYSQISGFLPAHVVREWREWEIQEDSILSIAVHPTYVSSSMAILGGINDGQDLTWPFYLGRINSHSVRTLRYSVFRMSNIILFSKKPDLGWAERSDDAGLREFLDHVVRGQSILPKLLDFASVKISEGAKKGSE